MEGSADIAVVGLAVMGMNLVLNMDDHGLVVVAHNRTVSKVDEFVQKTSAEGRRVLGARTLAEMVSLLRRPRKVVLLVKAGAPVDAMLAELVPLLSPGDIVVDGGNSLYTDTERRAASLAASGLHFVGCGVSGGEEGARRGPSLMPGGASEAWPALKPVLQAIAARTPDGAPCCDWVGAGGAGHFVKMVHNGIEYGDMQLICEAYHLLRDAGGLGADGLAAAFRALSKGPLESFLMDITADILEKRDDAGAPIVERIRDAAGQKGTGRWTVEASLELGAPVTLVGEAVFARTLSSMKDERVHASTVLGGTIERLTEVPTIKEIEDALYAAKVVSYAQGFMLFRRAAEAHGWRLDYAAIASMWMGGCIIRSAFLASIRAAYERDAALPSLLLDPFFAAGLARAVPGLRRVLAAGTAAGVPMPGLGAALAFFDGYRCGRLPANLLQAQRDYFGAHTFEWADAPGTWHHVNWTGTGGTTSSTHYNA